MRAIAAGVIVALVATGAAWGELTIERTKEIQGLVGKLGAKDFKTREEATKKLLELGQTVLGAVKKTAGETTDPEVKTRCAKVIAGMRLVEKKVRTLGKVAENTENMSFEIFNRDGTRIAYSVRKGKTYELWCDGKAIGSYDGGAQGSFSGDGQHFAYTAREGKRCFVVKDGEKKETEWELAVAPTMSRDGKRFAYLAQSGGKWCVVMDGKPGPMYEIVSWGSAPFSEDGKRYGYVAQREREGNEFVVLDGLEGPEYKEVQPPIFAPDGTRVAYLARGEDGWHWVVDGQKGPAHESMYGGAFSPDSKHFAYGVFDTDRGGCVVTDGKDGPKYSPLGEPVYAPDSQRLVYRANGKEGEMTAVDGKAGPLFSMIRGKAVFSPDSKHVGYVAVLREREGEEDFVVCDGLRGKEHKGCGSPAFSGDSKHVAYEAALSDGRIMVVDGIAGPKHESVRMPEGCTDVAGKLRYVAVDGGEAWLMEVEWPEGIDWTNGMKPIENQ